MVITNVTTAGSPDSAERDNLRMILEIFWPVQAAIVVGEPLCDLGTPLARALITLLMVI